MALWQVGFFVLPIESLEVVRKFEFFDEFGFDDAPFWRDRGVSALFFEHIDEILPRTKSWSEKITMFGNENSNRFEVLVEKDWVVSVSFRVDFTSDYEGVLRSLVEFFIVKGLIVLNERLDVLPLNFEALRNNIESSPQVIKYRRLAGI